MLKILSLAPFAVLRWLLFAPLQIAVNLLVILTSPFWAIVSVLFGISKFPFPLSLIHTHDDDLDGGQHQLGWAKVTGLKLIKQRMLWLCRNPGYGFAALVLGYKKEGSKVIYEDGPYWENYSVYHVQVTESASGWRYFHYRVQKEYGKRYMKLWLGWSNVANDGVNHMLKSQFHPSLSAS